MSTQQYSQIWTKSRTFMEFRVRCAVLSFGLALEMKGGAESSGIIGVFRVPSNLMKRCVPSLTDPIQIPPPSPPPPLAPPYPPSARIPLATVRFSLAPRRIAPRAHAADSARKKANFPPSPNDHEYFHLWRYFLHLWVMRRLDRPHFWPSPPLPAPSSWLQARHAPCPSSP